MVEFIEVNAIQYTQIIIKLTRHYISKIICLIKVT